MNSISIRKFFLFIFVFSLAILSCNGQLLNKNGSRKIEQGLFGKSPNKKKEIKVREPGAVVKAKKKQEAKEKRIKRDYAKFIKRSQERTFQIQTPEVQARMKQNKKDATTRDRAKKRNVRTSTREAGGKYK